MATNQVNGRRGGQVNFSTFIQDLNVEVPSQNNTSPVSEDWEKDIAMFTNTNFFEWDKASSSDFPSAPLPEPETKPAVAPIAPVAPVATTTTTPREPASATSAVGDFDFSLPG